MARVHIISFPQYYMSKVYTVTQQTKTYQSWRSGLSNNRWQAQHYGPLSLWTESECTVVLGTPVHSSAARQSPAGVWRAALPRPRSDRGQAWRKKGTPFKQYPKRLPVF